ncbi:MAG: YqzL family protein [Candidatus Goldbacteria bacterium]|nr:YqzL family protein [Candidatus Goldiibacteriota bacterium]
MEKTAGLNRLKELWKVFEKTGSVGAYLLYMEAKKQNQQKQDNEQFEKAVEERK